MSLDALTFGRLRNFNTADTFLLFISITSSLIYFVTLGLEAMPGRVYFKALSIAPLAVLAFRSLRRKNTVEAATNGSLRNGDNLILGMALVFSCIGDIYLEVDPVTLFVNGLLAFLVAHFAYILLFVRNWERPLRPSVKQVVATAAVLLYSLFFSHWLSGSLGAVANRVMVYVCTITAMVATSTLLKFRRPWVWIGAVLFLISDSIIAADKFKTSVPLRNHLVWVTYYLAQYFITLGFLREKIGEKRENAKHPK